MITAFSGREFEYGGIEEQIWRAEMPGRRILEEHEFQCTSYFRPDLVRRRAVLRETIRQFENAQPADRYKVLAQQNLVRWRDKASPHSGLKLLVLSGDWGEVTLEMTKMFGHCFAALNMANAHVPGGAYVEGAPAQEENMFRRTDCHFYIDENEYSPAADQYLPEMTALLTATGGRVYLDTKSPRVCIRGPEDRSREDLGYAWLDESDVFPFYELRASAPDLRDGAAFSVAEARKIIAAQLDTMIEKKVHHAVLGAAGCGAFQNPAAEVAAIYRREIEARRNDFSVIAFAIFNAGYGPDNYTPFLNEFASLVG